MLYQFSSSALSQSRNLSNSREKSDLELFRYILCDLCSDATRHRPCLGAEGWGEWDLNSFCMPSMRQQIVLAINSLEKGTCILKLLSHVQSRFQTRRRRVHGLSLLPSLHHSSLVCTASSVIQRNSLIWNPIMERLSFQASPPPNRLQWGIPLVILASRQLEVASEKTYRRVRI